MFRFNNLSKFKEIGHFISDRRGGISPAPYDTLNIGFNTADLPANVLKNRELLAHVAGFDINSLTTLKQTHSDNIAVITPELRGRGSKDYSSAINDSDALITCYPDILLLVQVADCVPILLYDPAKKVIAAVHAGWKGTVKNIAEKTVNKMIDDLGSDPKDIIAGIGPSIGPCCYEVGKEVIHDAGNMKGFIDKRGKFDLWRANEAQLIQGGLKHSNIKIASVCTMCNKDIYFSSRTSGGVTGRFGAGIILK